LDVATALLETVVVEVVGYEVVRSGSERVVEERRKDGGRKERRDKMEWRVLRRLGAYGSLSHRHSVAVPRA